MGNNVDRKKKPFYKGKRPICPFCGAEMEIVRYIGYNESFNYWSCPECGDDKLDKYNPDCEQPEKEEKEE